MGLITLIDIQRYIDVARGRSGQDPAHDFLHVMRVFDNAKRILRDEPADEAIVLVSVLLHELFNYPKDHPESHLSGDVCAEAASAVMKELRFPEEKRVSVMDSIANHSFSKGVIPTFIEGKILQDADRLDSIGAIGVARCFATCASMERPFYHLTDPLCESHTPNDKLYGVDHFFTKLLRVPQTLHTETAKRLAGPRIEWMQGYLVQLRQEVLNDWNEDDMMG